MAVRQYKEIRLYVLKLVDTRQQRSGGTRTNSEMGRRLEASWWSPPSPLNLPNTVMMLKFQSSRLGASRSRQELIPVKFKPSFGRSVMNQNPDGLTSTFEAEDIKRLVYTPLLTPFLHEHNTPRHPRVTHTRPNQSLLATKDLASHTYSRASWRGSILP